ncbi:MAG: hypothetical protein KH704_09185 [Clostridiales bacterium]|nr:hypothetical protein [Clostridiales bacterium]
MKRYETFWRILFGENMRWIPPKVCGAAYWQWSTRIGMPFAKKNKNAFVILRDRCSDAV